MAADSRATNIVSTFRHAAILATHVPVTALHLTTLYRITDPDPPAPAADPHRTAPHRIAHPALPAPSAAPNLPPTATSALIAKLRQQFTDSKATFRTY